MQAIVKEFLIPMGFCVICAVGGWALGRDSAPARVATDSNSSIAGRVHVQSAGAAEHHLDTTGTLQRNQPRLIRCEVLQPAIARRRIFI